AGEARGVGRAGRGGGAARRAGGGGEGRPRGGAEPQRPRGRLLPGEGALVGERRQPPLGGGAPLLAPIAGVRQEDLEVPLRRLEAAALAVEQRQVPVRVGIVGIEADDAFECRRRAARLAALQVVERRAHQARGAVL